MGEDGNNETFSPAKNNAGFNFKVSDVQSLKLEEGQVVPKFLNNTQRTESLQQLSTNMLPPYLPEAIPAFLENSNFAENHCCSDCGDTFMCKSSLSFHLQRRSVLIRFSCDSCRNVQAFYNRCSLMSHIRAHADKGEKSDISKAVLSPLPRVLMEGFQSGVMQNLEEEEEEESFHSSSFDEEMPNPTKLLEVSISEGEEEEEQQPEAESGVKDSVISAEALPDATLIDEPVKPKKKLRCSECVKEFDTFADRIEHFTNKDRIPFTVIMCPKCSILCPTECSFKAHKRLHLQISPYVCPECGDNPDRYWESFQNHLKYQCLHYSRAVSYKCSLCSGLFAAHEALKRHFSLHHSEILFKCHRCPVAFTSLSNFHSHRRTAHSANDIPYNQFVKCAVCEVVFTSKGELENHLGEHVKECSCQYAFKCMECGNAVSTKLALRDHIKRRHARQFSQNISFFNLPYEQFSQNISFLNLPSENQEKSTLAKKNPDNPALEFNKMRIECLLCHGDFLSRQGYSMHVTKSHSNHKYPCGVCHRPAMNRLEMVSHGKEHLRRNIMTCLLCHNKVIKASETLDVHLLYHVEQVRFQTPCPICDSMLYNFEEALQHLRTEHLLKNTAITIVKSDKAATKATECNNSKDVEKGVKRRVDGSIKTNFGSLVNAKNSNESLGSTTHSKRLETGESICGKCSFKSTDRGEFKNHILTHKESKSSFQCQECGMCFVVEPSLKKHLKIVHKILDIDTYISEEGTSHSPESEDVPEAIKANELECTVCFEVFASDTQLKTHMRSHGMAFIQAKKTALS